MSAVNFPTSAGHFSGSSSSGREVSAGGTLTAVVSGTEIANLAPSSVDMAAVQVKMKAVNAKRDFQPHPSYYLIRV